jgi:RNA polymerase sigma-70 factor (ECF subfamily)
MGERFPTTRWSLVAAARDPASPEAAEALRHLCQAYWYPLYAFVRRQGHSVHDAQDLTQGFFTDLIERRSLGSVDRSKGRLRSFLLASLKHFLAKERARERAQKRGGGTERVGIEVDRAEERFRREPAHGLTPEHLFERGWALTLLERALGEVRQEWASRDRGDEFDLLKGALIGESSTSYLEMAARLGTTEGAVRVAAHRLRRRFRHVLEGEIGRTVRDPVDVADEIRYLFKVLGGQPKPSP